MKMLNLALVRTWIVGACAVSFAVHASAADASRFVQSLDENWPFQLGITPGETEPGYNDSAWRVMDVPLDYFVSKTNPFPDAKGAGKIKLTAARAGLPSVTISVHTQPGSLRLSVT